MRRNEYEELIEKIRLMFPHSTDVRIEVDSNMKDIRRFSDIIHEHSEAHFPIVVGDTPKDRIYSRFRTPFGMISINNKDGK